MNEDDNVISICRFKNGKIQKQIELKTYKDLKETDTTTLLKLKTNIDLEEQMAYVICYHIERITPEQVLCLIKND